MSDILNYLITDKETVNVWKIFYNLSKYPRGSKNEKDAIEYVVRFVKENNLVCEIDTVGNILIKTKTNCNSENTVCLQSHIDMVCVKDENISHDFLKDPITLEIKEDGFISAKGTTLGADNGIGLAISLALLLDNSFNKPNLEILITTDEETGLNGAKNFSDDKLKAKTLINLDSEEEGIFSIGCAGGVDCEAISELNYIENIEKIPAYELIVKNLAGGHSGINIHENHRINAIQLLSRILLNIGNVSLSSINGGRQEIQYQNIVNVIFQQMFLKIK